MVIESSIAFPNRSPPPLLPPQAFDRASLMDPLDSPLLAARSRYDPHPPPPHHLVEPNCYPHQSHHHHHHHASFPSPTPPPPPYCSHHARYLRHERESRLPVDDGGRLRVPYQIDPFPQPPLSFPDRSPLPDDLYPTLRPHLIGHEEHFVRDSPESRVFYDDRFRVVDESQDFLRLRWEDEEERRHLVACSRANLYREDLAVGLERRKRPRWLKDTDLEEHLGGPSKRHLRVWDREIDHPHRILPPSPSTIPACDSSLRTPRDFVAIDGKSEADFVAEWRYLLPPMKSYSDKEREDNRGERPLHMPFYSDRNKDIVRDREDMRELGPILERHLRSPFPTMRSTGNSYSHINRQFETTSDVYDLPTTSTVYSREENNFGDNRGKRKLNRENDQIIIWSSGKQTAKRPSAKLFNRGKEQIVISTSSKQSAKRPSALSRLQSGISVWSRLQEKPLFHTSPSELVSQPTTSVKHQLEVSTPNFSLKSSNLVGEVSSPRSALLTSDGKGQEWWTPKRLVKKKLARKGEESAIPVVSGSLVLEAKDGISKMLTPNTSQKKLDDPEASDNQRSSSIKDVNNANLGSSSRRAISTVTMDEDIGQELMDDNVREEEGAFHSVIGGKVKETNCIVEKQEIELDTCANLELCQSEFIDTETAEKNVLTDPSRCDGEEKGKQFVELGQTLNQNCANALLDIGDLNIGSSSPINHVSIEGKLDDETEQLSSALQAQNTIDENHDSQNFEGSDDNKKAGDLDKDFVTFSSEYSSSPLRKSEQLVMPVGHMTSSLTSYSIFADNLKMKQHTVGNQHIEVDVDAKEHKEISGGNSAKSDAYLCMEMQNLLVNLPPQLMDTASDGYLPDITTDEKDACLASQANVESPQSDNLKPREEDLVASSIFMSEFQDASPCVAPEQPHSGLPDRYGCNKDGLIKDICDQDQKVVTEDKYLLAFREPLAPEVEGVTSAQNISCKPMFEKENNLLSDDTMKQKTMESKDMNGQEHLNQKTMSTVGLPKDTPIRANLVKCSKESTHSHLSLRHKTWHRKNAPSSISQVILQSQKGGSLSKLSPRKLGKIHNSYVRKGNSLFRKSASQPSESLGSMRKLNKGITDKNIVFGSNGFANNILASSNPSFESKLSSEPTQPSQSLGSTSQLNKDIKEKIMNSGKNILNCPNNAIERPKTPPLPLATKVSDSTFVYSSEAPHVLSENSVAETRTDFQDTPLILPSGGINDQNDMSDKICEPLGKSVIYVKRRSNQLVAASGQKVTDSVNSSLDKSPALISLASSDYYYRKNKNQLIRNAYSSESQSNVALHPRNGNMSGQKVSGSTVNCVTSTLPKKKLNKAQDKRHKYSSFSHVWTLSGKRPSKKGISSLRRIKFLPYLFPWKRATLLQSLKSQLVRKKDTLYTLRTDGFFLKKSGLSRLGRSSLKWSRSMQRRSKEAELAAAEVERKNREQDNLLSVSGLKHSINSVLNEQSCDKDQGTGNNSISLVPWKSLGGNNDRYVRIGNGNQLVRDPKKLTRILASEKVRWSLHTARLRLAKKNQYCQFFTRFGKCNKKGGKCPYIHDPSKVAICTKFLNGSCSNMDCKLAHKIIPERMPDCSYFLRGLCTNTSCSYRHVNVNPNASVCEGFLKGYCVDGDECCKKHSYVCPIYQATGKCLQGSKCKLHHPKTKNKPKKRKDTLVQGNTWGRYFGSGISLVGEPLAVSLDTKVEKKANDLFCNGWFAEFIALAPDGNDDEASFMVSEADAHPTHFESGDDALQNNDLDALTKPIRIMRKDYPPLPASTNGS